MTTCRGVGAAPVLMSGARLSRRVSRATLRIHRPPIRCGMAEWLQSPHFAAFVVDEAQLVVEEAAVVKSDWFAKTRNGSYKALPVSVKVRVCPKSVVVRWLYPLHGLRRWGPTVRRRRRRFRPDL